MLKTIIGCDYTDPSCEDRSTLSLTNNMSPGISYDWQSCIAELELYCEDREWTVEFSKKKHDEARPLKAHIVLNTRHKPEILYYFFLHELGHMLMVLDDPNYDSKYKVLSERSNWSQTYRVYRVEEEIEAWNTGHELAISLDLPINKPKFEELKASMVSSYMLWATHRKHPHAYFNRSRPLPGIYEDEDESTKESDSD